VSGNGKSPEDEDPGGLDASPASPAPEPAPPGELAREVAELKDQLLRRRADFENYKKRVERDREAARHEMAAAIFAELIPTIDNLERALFAGGDAGSLRAGVEMIHRELLAVFDRHEVRAEDPTGRPFDPNLHQALSHEAVPGLPEGTVAEAFRKGYTYRERLLRPALVKVAKGEDDEEDGAGTEPQEGSAREES
jgi:molecular chaperone GrpE